MTTTNRDYMQTHSNAFNADLEKITLPTCSLLELTSTSTKVTTVLAAGSWQLPVLVYTHIHVVLQVMVVGMCTIESYTHILLVHTCSMNVMIIHVHMSIVLSMYFFIIESYYHGRIFICSGRFISKMLFNVNPKATR